MPWDNTCKCCPAVVVAWSILCCRHIHVYWSTDREPASFSTSDTHCHLLFFNLTAVLTVHPGPVLLGLLLILLLEDTPKLGDQGGSTGCHTPCMLLNRL